MPERAAALPATSRSTTFPALHLVVDAIARTTPIDRSHVVYAGFSNGGMLALRAGCQEAPELAGIIVVSGSLQVSTCKPASPLTVVAGHGALDNTVPISGEKFSSFLQSPVTSQAASLAPFLAADSCTLTTMTRRSGYVVTRNRECRNGTLIDTYESASEGHDWPGPVPGGASFASTAWALLGGRPSVTPYTP